MVATAVAMALVLATWALLAAAFVGAGLLVRRGLGLRPGGAGALLDAFWAGWAATVASLQLWHLALPVAGRAALAAGAAGALGWLLGARGLRQSWPARDGRSRAALVSAGVFLAGALFLAWSALGPPTSDTGLYHLSAVRWIKT